MLSCQKVGLLLRGLGKKEDSVRKIRVYKRNRVILRVEGIVGLAFWRG